MSLSDNLKRIRINRKLTQKELAKKSGITRESIGNYERGDRTPPADILKKIAEALGVSIDTLTSDESFDFEIFFVAQQLIGDCLPNNKDELICLAEYTNIDSEILKDFQSNKTSHFPLDCIKCLLSFISEKSPNEFNKIYDNLIAPNIYDLDDEIKEYCHQIYIKTIDTPDINSVASVDEFLLFITSHGYSALKLNNETLKYLYEKVTDLLDFEFYKLEKNDFILPNDKK